MDVIVSPSLISPATQSGGQTPQFTVGQVVDAVVLSLLQDDSVRVLIADTVLDVRSEIPLEPGTTLRFAVKSAAEGLRLVPIPGSVRPPGHTPSEGAPAPVTASSQRGEGASLSPRAEVGSPVPGTPAPGGEQPERAAPAVSAVVNAVRLAAPRQAGLAPLFASLERLTAMLSQSALTASGATARTAAPAGPPVVPQGATTAPAAPAVQAVRVALNDLLALRLPADTELTAGDIRAAFQRSGLFMEQNLAAGSATPDLKLQLSALRAALTALLQAAPDAATTPTPAPPGPMATRASPEAPPPSAPMPPFRGAAPSAQPAVSAAISDDMSPRDAVQKVLDQTEAALSRQTLLQAASLPERAPERVADTGPRWLFEVPLATPQGTSVAQFEISRDGRQGASPAVASVWRARFSVAIEPLGPVHAQIALSGERAAVTLWAERPQTAEQLRGEARQLTVSLAEAALEGEVQVRSGSPRVPPPETPPTGRFLDKAS